MLLFGVAAYAQDTPSATPTATGNHQSAKMRREARKAAFSANISRLIESRSYIFRPITMQNIVSGNTHNIFAYYLYVDVDGDRLTMHLPVEFTSFVISTVNLDAYTEEYKATLTDGNWRITFSFMNGAERWFAEYFISTITGQARLALVTPNGVMRYLGTIEKASQH